ncbi:MAG: diguanylate cyclase (GGDEF)-like protein [Candidatus Aldehydirespiratoraceae bacterium]|jgi:diguanylate cyclase (GGDEF)-like protein
MIRWLLLSPTIVSVVAMLGGLASAVYVFESRAEGVIIGAGTAAVLAGGVTLLQRTFGRSTKTHLEESEYRACHDPLTGLLNRSGLMEALTAAIRRAKANNTCVGVVFSDLDRFKVVNDSLGHTAGDYLLVGVANRLQDSLRTADVVGRFGGDEFVVICHGLIEPASISRVAESVFQAFDEPFAVDDGHLAILPSIGVAIWDPSVDPTVTAEDLVRDADAAMYEAKRTKCRISLFDAGVRHNLLARLKIEQSLSVAFDSELVVHYQPVIDTKKKTMHSTEALVRWQHPEHGLLFPKDFLPVAEEAGLMGRIGDVVLREACAQAAQWNALNRKCRDLAINVNVSEHQLLDVAFPERVADALEWSGLPANQLCLEISEDLVTEHLSGSLPVLEQIARQGVRLSLDDFGTGRTTMSHLKRLNDVVHQVKIDRTFVTELPTDPIDQAVVEAVSRIALAAGLSVVAEGVETSRQADKLISLGIHHHQGFLYSRGVEAERLTKVFMDSAASLPVPTEARFVPA